MYELVKKLLKFRLEIGKKKKTIEKENK